MGRLSLFMISVPNYSEKNGVGPDMRKPPFLPLLRIQFLDRFLHVFFMFYHTDSVPTTP